MPVEPEGRRFNGIPISLPSIVLSRKVDFDAFDSGSLPEALRISTRGLGASCIGFSVK